MTTQEHYESRIESLRVTLIKDLDNYKKYMYSDISTWDNDNSVMLHDSIMCLNLTHDRILCLKEELNALGYTEYSFETSKLLDLHTNTLEECDALTGRDKRGEYEVKTTGELIDKLKSIIENIEQIKDDPEIEGQIYAYKECIKMIHSLDYYNSK